MSLYYFAPHESMLSSRQDGSSRSLQRSAKGFVNIKEASPEGRFIVLENTHRGREEALGNWKLKRKIDGKREIIYTFPQNFILKPKKEVKVWAYGQGGIHNPPEELVYQDETTFGAGSFVQTLLFNEKGEERATHIQRFS